MLTRSKRRFSSEQERQDLLICVEIATENVDGFDTLSLFQSISRCQHCGQVDLPVGFAIKALEAERTEGGTPGN